MYRTNISNLSKPPVTPRSRHEEEEAPLVPQPAVISGLSPEEEVRALQLGDIAFHNPLPVRHASQPAGKRVKADHRRLIEEVEAEKILNSKRVA
jgi:hypothetical protein